MLGISKTTVADIIKTKTAALDVFNKTIVKLGLVKQQLETKITDSETEIVKHQASIADADAEITTAKNEIENINTVVGKISHILGA